MSGAQYSPYPREIPLNENRQATVFFERIGKRSRSGVPKIAKNGRRKILFAPGEFVKHRQAATAKSHSESSNIARATTRATTLGTSKPPGHDSEEQGPQPALDRLFCGCKFGLGTPGPNRLHHGVGWKRASVSVSRRYQAEPAMAYHILTHNASCLPLDLYHREGFEPHKDRATFQFGVDHAAAKKNFQYLLPDEVRENREDEENDVMELDTRISLTDEQHRDEIFMDAVTLQGEKQQHMSENISTVVQRLEDPINSVVYGQNSEAMENRRSTNRPRQQPTGDIGKGRQKLQHDRNAHNQKPATKDTQMKKKSEFRHRRPRGTST